MRLISKSYPIYVILTYIFWFGFQNLTASTKSPFEKIKWETKCTPFFLKESEIKTQGAFAGFINDNIIWAGGTSVDFRQWNRSILCLSKDSKLKSYKDKIHVPLAYGVSIELSDGLLCVGGRDSSRCYDKCFLIMLKNGQPTISTQWPSLPIPISNATGALLGNKIYIAGGKETINPIKLSKHFFVLDLSNKEKGWIELPVWPGSARENALCTVQNNGTLPCFYLFGGQIKKENNSLEYLTDGYVYNPQLGTWSPLNLQFPKMLSIAIPSGANHIFLCEKNKSDKVINRLSKETEEYILWKYHTITQTIIKTEVIPCLHNINTILQKDKSIFIISNDTAQKTNKLYTLQGKIISQKKGLGYFNILVIFSYFAILSAIGFYFSRRQKSTNDYFRGGGRIPWWAAGLSLFATALSAITFMAIPAKAYATDWSYALFNVGILFVAPIIVFLFIPFFRKLNITTAYQYLEIRFNSLIRVICSCAFILFQIGRMGVVLFLPSIALNVVTGLDIFLCIGVMGICSILYTMIGGIEAVVWTDAIQVLILLGGAIFTVVYIACSIPGGFSEVISIAVADGKFNLGATNFNLRDSTMWTVIIATCFTNLTTYGTDQSMVQRYLTTSSLKEAQKSVWTNAVLTIPATIIFFLIGTGLYVYYKTSPEELSVLISNGDAIFPWYIFTQLPAGVLGLLISGIFAAAMSTLSGSMNSAATVYIIDIRSKFIHGEQKKSELAAARIATCFIGIISLFFAFLMATWDIASLWDEFNKILGLILGSMGGLFMLGMLTKRANSKGAIIGIITSIIVQLFIAKFQTLHLLLYTTSGFISCFVVGYITSLFFERKKD